MANATRPPANKFVAVATKIYNPVGFSKGYNFVLWFIFLGAFFGFTLARLQYLDFYGTFCAQDASDAVSHAAPGECFYWLQQPYNVGMILHLGGILPGSLLACVQFVPVVRHKVIMVHRVNGYIVLLLSILGTTGAFIVSPKPFGGGADAQTGTVVLGAAFLLALLLSYINIKRLQIDQHRAWMLRAWVYAGCIITNRIITFAGASLISNANKYYPEPCDKLDWLLGNQTLSLYPECASFYSGQNPHQTVAVLANLATASSAAEAGAALNAVWGMALWLAFIIHVLGIEIYLHLTPAESQRLRQVSYERQLAAGMKHPGSAGLTADRLGDAPKWEPLSTESFEKTSRGSV